jgi:type IV pilus assembly protein PilC
MEDAGVFPPYMVHMTKIGEETGNLESVMDQLDSHYTREEDMRKSRLNAVLYPVILTCIMLAVIIVLLTEVMPVFDQVFATLGTEMSGLAKGLLHLGMAARSYAVVFVIITAVLLAYAIFVNTTKKGHASWRKFSHHFKSARVRDHDAAAAEFASTMAMALGSGLTPEQSVDLSAELNEDPDEAARLKAIQDDLANSVGLTESFTKNGMFRGVYAHMAAIGEKTGTLDQVLSEISDLYRDDLDAHIESHMAVIQPVLIIVLSLIVGIIMLSVMFPLLGILSGM